MVKRIHILILAISSFSCSIVFGQSIHTVISGGYIDSYSIFQKKSGDYVISGSCRNGTGGYGDPYFIGLDSSGTLLWSRFYSNTSLRGGYLLPTNDGGYLQHGLNLIKFDSSWSIEWTFSGLGSGRAIQSSDGEFVMGSYSADEDLSLPRVSRISKLDKGGNLLWHREWHDTTGGMTMAFGRGVIEASDGYICYGSSAGSDGQPSGIFLTSFTADGSLRWNRSITRGSNIRVDATKVMRTSDDHFVLYGWTGSSSNGDMLIFEFDNSGTIRWLTSIEAFGSDIATGVPEQSDGTLLVVGSTSVDLDEGIVLCIIDRQGKLLTARRMLIPGHSLAPTDMIRNQQGVPVVTGRLDPNVLTLKSKVIALTIDENMCSVNNILVSIDHPAITIDSNVNLDTVSITVKMDTTNKLTSNGIQSDLCKVAVVSEQTTNEQTVSLFPNPIVQSHPLILRIPITIAPDLYFLVLRDALGKQVYSEKNYCSGSQEISVSTTTLPGGIYTVDLLNANTFASIYHGKVVNSK